MGVFHSTGMDPPVISLREQSGDRPGTGMKRHRCAVLSSVSTQLSIHSAHLGCSRCDSLAPTVAPTAWAADRQIGQGSSAAMKEEKKNIKYRLDWKVEGCLEIQRDGDQSDRGASEAEHR